MSREEKTDGSGDVSTWIETDHVEEKRKKKLEYGRCTAAISSLGSSMIVHVYDYRTTRYTYTIEARRTRFSNIRVRIVYVYVWKV